MAQICSYDSKWFASATPYSSWCGVRFLWTSLPGLPKSNGHDAIKVVVDHLSNYSHFIPLKHPFTACSIVFLFVKDMVRLHGIPESIQSDEEPLFCKHFLEGGVQADRKQF
jgi:hypothetical protein